MNSFRTLLAVSLVTLLAACDAPQTSIQTPSEPAATSNDSGWVFGMRYVGGTLVPYGNGDIWVEQSAVMTFIPNEPKHPPIVMIPGMGLAGSMYTTTPDGNRKGWAQIFVEAGYPVYVYELPEYSTAGGFDINMFERILNPLQANQANFGNPYVSADTPCIQPDPNAAPAAMGMGGAAGPICPEPLAEDVSAPSFVTYPEANLRAWVGLEEDGTPWPKSLFPMDDYSAVQFEKSFPYRWNDNRSGIENFDHAPLTGRGEAEALVGLYEEIGEPFIILAHSAGARNVQPFLNAKPEAVRALIGYEPEVLFEDREKFIEQMKGKPYLALYGDNVEARGHGGRFKTNSVELIPSLQEIGNVAEAITLPELGIYGNSHMMAQDKNNAEIAGLLIDWLNKNVQ